MSTTIDQKVVEMRFDNSNFEKNTRQTMSTLEKLKEKLNLTGATKGLENIDTHVKKIDFSGFSNGIETVKSKFSALEVMGVMALANITNSAVNAGKRIVSALTIDPIKSGFEEYETQINAVQTILANTSSKGTTLEDVNAALDELNTYADKTIYNFTEMTRNIGTFTAAGVDLKTSVSAIQGIANLAAVSGSTSQQASTAMYQLSQALANGKVNLQDWNSVVNAGMGGQVFQDALKRTAKNMGTDVDALIKKYGSFRESLTKGEWLTTEVLTKTLEQFTMAAEEGSEEWNNFKKSLMKQGYTEKQATEILKMGNTATDAATKVKTFTQLWDTLKETAQSGWTQTWEILVGDFEEAKKLLTSISDVVGDAINKMSENRNKLLQGWKDAGGRTTTIEALKNAFQGIINIITPIKEAFREIFPPMTVDQLTSFSDKFRNLTARFADFTKKHGPQIKSTFKGIFAVLDVFATIVSKIAGGIFKITGSLLGFTGGILSGTASLGDFLTKIRDSVKQSNLFGKTIDKVVGFLQNGINKLKEFGSTLKESFKSKGYEGFVGFLKAIWELITKIGTGLSNALGGISKGIANAFGENSFGDVINTGLSGGLLVGLFSFIKNLNKPLTSLSEIFKNFKEGTSNITGILDDVRGCLQAYQDQLKAGTLLKIASAIGILAASVWVISTINPEMLGKSLAAITVLFGELAGTMFILTKITPGLKSTLATIPLMLSMSTAMLILAAALKIIGSLDPKSMVTGLVGIAGGMGVLVGALHLMPEKNVNKAAKAIRKLSTSLLILSVALKIAGSLSWGELARGLIGITVGLGALVAAVNLLPKDTGLRTLGLIGLATSLVILGTALKIVGSLSWSELTRGLTGITVGLIALVAAVNLLPKTTALRALGMIGLATSLVILGKALKIMGSMSWKEIGKGLTVLGGSLLILSVALMVMKKSIAGAAALLVAATALNILIIPLKVLGSMSWGSIIKSLVSLAGVFVILGVAGAVLSPMVPAILGLAGALALLGVTTVLIGGGLMLLGAGITSLAASLAVGATAIVAGLNVIIFGLINLIPTIATTIAKAIVTFIKVIADSAPQIADSILKLISELLKSLATYMPIIANSLFDLLIGALDVLAARMPELITSTVKVINNFFVGVANALKNIDGTNLLKGVIAVAIMTGLAYALAGISSIVGPAMIGLLGVGALIGELALVLAAIGGLSKIPGLSWLVGEGGNLLQGIGTAIGQFIGGIVGGIAKGFTNSLPDVATNLSEFMTSIKPFIDGAKSIDRSVLTGIGTLIQAILAVTGANIINSIMSFIAGKDSLTTFGKQLIPFGKSMKAYSEEVSGIDATAIKDSAIAAKALTDVANAIPNSGGIVSLFTGDNKISDFAKQLTPFGTSLKEYSLAVSGIDTQAILNSADAANALTQMANTIPNEGGIKAWFTGDNSVAKFAGELPKLGEGLKGFSDETAEIVPENIVACSNAAKALAEMMSVIPNEGGIKAWFTGDNSVAKFSKELPKLGTGLKEFSDEITDINAESITAAASAAKSLAEMMSVIPNEGGIKAWFTGGNSVSKFAGYMPKLGEGLKGFSDSIADINAENISTAATAAKAIAEMTTAIPNEGGMKAWFTGDNSVAKFANDIPKLGTGLKGFSDEITDIKPDNISAAATAAKSIADLVSVIPNEGGMKAWFTGDNSVAKFANDIPKLGTGLKGFSDEITDIKAENVTAGANAAKALAEMTAIIPTEGGIKAWFTGSTSISNFADKLPNLGTGLKGFSDSISGINPENVIAGANAAKALAEMAETTPKDTKKIIEFGTNLGTFGDKLKTYFEKTKDIGADTIKISTDAVSSIKTSISGLNSGTLSSTAEAITKLVEAIGKMSSISKDSVTGFADAMKQLAETNLTTIIESFSKAESKLKEVGSSAIDKLKEGINSKKSEVEKACNEIGKSMSTCASKLKTYYQSFYNAGSHLVNGFANGISQNSYKAAAKAKAMAKAAEEAARNELKINSPSKVFRKIGSGVPEGFAQGISMLGSTVRDSVSGMSNTAISGTSKAISHIADIVNMDIDSQPTIRPVLDLSDVESGAGYLSSLFNKGPSIGVMSNLNAISSGVNAKIQNGENSEVISAINRLGKNLDGTRGNTYNVNGVTYDDGSNISDAVETIIRAAIRERRV